MNRAATAIRELVGLFVDDWRYALAILVWIGAVAVVAQTFGLTPGARGLTFAGGLVAIFLGSLALRR
jgi:hypothetical protein